MLKLYEVYLPSNNEPYMNVRQLELENAFKRIDRGSFGYCQFTGNQIGLERLKALPFANLFIEALEDTDTWQ